MLEPVKLSLATFQPDKCYPPYLNTPRSLEACRMNGVNPLELVEIPFSEFQRDFPNDIDAARRRFERIDGARRRLLDTIKQDWKKLCDSGWKPPAKARPRSAKEAILEVPPEAHCELLEIQAAKFRKIERDNWMELQRHLKMEIVKADQEVQNKQILAKHDGIEEKNNQYQNERRIFLQELYRDQLLQRKMDEEEELEEIKEEQKLFQKTAIQKSQMEKEQKRRDKMLRERREYERLQRDKYTQEVKGSIMKSIEDKVENRRHMSLLRQKNNEDRVKEFFDRKNKEQEDRRNFLDKKIEQVNAEKERIAAEQRKAVLDKIEEHERHRREVEAARERYKTEIQPMEQNEGAEKLRRIQEIKNNMTKEKADKTLSDLQLRDDIAKRELEKIQEAQERRRAIKAIRQEAHEIALMRARKMEEYRLTKLKETVKHKEDRMAAIKQGFHVLDHMRCTMKDIMLKTSAEIKNEMNHLRHVDEFSPDKVAMKAMEVGNQVLFPRLQKKFGIQTQEDDPMKKLYATTGGMNTSGSANDFGFGLGTQPLTEMDTAPLYEGDRTALTEDGTRRTAPNSRSQSRGRSTKQRSHSPKRELTTLQIQALNQDTLKNSLLQSINRVESLRTSQSMTGNATSMKTLSPKKLGKGDEHDPRYPAPILKLRNEDGTWEEEDHQSSTTGRHSSVTKGTGINSLMMFNDPAPGKGKKSPTESRGRSRQSRQSVRQLRQKGAEARAASLSPDHSLASQKDNDHENNTDLPQINFTAGEEYANCENENGSPSSERKSPSATEVSPSKFGGAKVKKVSKSESLRTDKNEKAKFGKLPPGKFRREFSLDHPLAPNGKGKYMKEMQQGLKPVGLFLNPILRVNQDIEETLILAEKMEKLTYEAQTSILEKTLDENNDKSIAENMDNLKKQLNAKLEDLIEEERIAEEERLDALKKVSDPQEKYNMELIFAEERTRASDRIIAQTKENESIMKKELLKTMKLGTQLQHV